MAAFFINTGKTGKWRKEFHSAIFPVTIGKKAANRLYMKLTRDSRRFSVFFVKIYCLKDRKFLATKILVLATKPKKVFPWNLSPVVQRGASISCAETIFTQSSQRQFCRAKIFLKMKSITDSYLFSFLAMRRSLAIRAFTGALNPSVEKLSESIFLQWPPSCVSSHKLKSVLSFETVVCEMLVAHIHIFVFFLA